MSSVGTILEQRLFERYQAALSIAVARHDTCNNDNAFRAWDAWLAVAFPNPGDRATIPDPRLLGSRRGAT